MLYTLFCNHAKGDHHMKRISACNSLVTLTLQLWSVHALLYLKYVQHREQNDKHYINTNQYQFYILILLNVF